jgi:hypothetical protein
LVLKYNRWRLIQNAVQSSSLPGVCLKQAKAAFKALHSEQKTDLFTAIGGSSW